MKRLVALLCMLSQAFVGVQSQTMAGTDDVSLPAWLQKVNDASHRRAYTGTFVVSAGNAMSSARIWHVCEGGQQMERVESLNGPARSTFRRNEQVVTFFPDSRLALSESRESLGTFPSLMKSGQVAVDEYYQIRSLGGERVVGLDADVVQLKPKDAWRFGYRVWTEKKSGLVVRLQTLDAQGQVLEQSAFSELQLDAPVSMAKLLAMMNNTTGYRVDRPEMHKTTADDQGWVVRANVAGFQPIACYRRVLIMQPPADAITQCMFSDGLATLSLFMEPYDSRRGAKETVSESSGATHTLGLRNGDWWITAVGEVPLRTLQSFALALERKK